jgi:excisionase family DNA binding protein
MLKANIDVVTTQEAATILGISVTSVQKLVERGELLAWKTQGGHRRIARAALSDFMGQAAEQRNDRGPIRSSVLIVEDDDMMRTVYLARMYRWGLPLDISLCRSGYEGLIEIGVSPPDILLLDIRMRGIDGYEIMQTVLARPGLRHTHIAIVTSMERSELEERGGIPPGVALFHKPVPFEQLQGFLTACCMQKQRMCT